MAIANRIVSDKIEMTTKDENGGYIRNLEKKNKKISSEIVCISPNDISSKAEQFFEITNDAGRKLTYEMINIMKLFTINWTGTDATINLNALLDIYTIIGLTIIEMQRLIVEVNNQKLVSLQEHIVKSGSECAVGKKLEQRLYMKTFINNLPTINETESINLTPTFYSCVERVAKSVTTHKNIISDLRILENSIVNNLYSGCGREGIIDSFEALFAQAGDNQTMLEGISEKLNLIAENKQKQDITNT